MTLSNLTKGKAKLISKQTDKISQQPENWENCNGPDLVQTFPKKWWVESDFTAPIRLRPPDPAYGLTHFNLRNLTAL
jgi:hypothetical protein